MGSGSSSSKRPPEVSVNVVPQPQQPELQDELTAAGPGHRAASLRRVQAARRALAAIQPHQGTKSRGSPVRATVLMSLWSGSRMEKEVVAATVGELLRAARNALEVDVDVICEGVELQHLPSDLGLYDGVCRSFPATLQAYVAGSVERAKWLENLLELQIDSVRRLVYGCWWSSINSGCHSDCETLVSRSKRAQSAKSEPEPELVSLVRDLQEELMESVGPNGFSALETAIESGDANLCRILVEARANLETSLDRALVRLDCDHRQDGQNVEDVCRILWRDGVEIESFEAWKSKKPWERCLRAAATGCTWLVEDLLQKEKLKFEDVVCPRTQWSLTLEAALTSNGSLMKLAMQKGRKVTTCDRSGRSALHYAALQGDEQLLVMIAETPGQCALDHLDSADELGRTPLWYAARGGHSGVCSWLCARRCDPAKRDIEGTNAYFQAVCSSRSGPAQQVLASLFPGKPCLDHQFFEHTADDKVTLWHAAAMTNAVPAVEWMLQHAESPSDILCREGMDGDTPLLRATMEGHVEMALLLITLRADPGLLASGSPRDWAELLPLPELQNFFWRHRNEIADAGWAVRWNAYRLAAKP
eukprot:s2708_g5.t1